MEPTRVYTRDDIRIDTYQSRDTERDSRGQSIQEEVISISNPGDMRLRLASSMVVRSAAGVSLIALEAGRRSGQPGDRLMAQEYRKIADRSLEWLNEKGVL